jgi:WD40 repeat protein
MTAAVGASPRAADRVTTPFKGLTNFEEADYRIFFGRDRERRLIGATLLASRFTVIYGPSGVGKSSLLRAGVVHDLRERALADLAERGPQSDRRGPRFIPLVFSDWRDDPMPALEACVRTAAEPLVPGSGPEPSVSRRLDDLVQSWNEATGATLVVVLDQFEEYLLSHGVEHDEAEDSFGAGLVRAVNRRDLNVRFGISIRDDAVAKVSRYDGRIPRLLDTMIPVEHLDVTSAEAAIRRPIDRYNEGLAPDETPYSIEDELVATVLEQTQIRGASRNGHGPASENNGAGSSRVEPAFLQLVMERLWREETAADSHVLRLATLERLHGTNEIVHKHLTDAVEALTPKQQDVAATIFQDLVLPSRQKIPQLPSDLVKMNPGLDEDGVRTVLEQLAKRRIVKSVAPPPGTSESRYEIFHDKLADPILEWRAGHEATREAEERAHKARRRAAISAAAAVGCFLIAAVCVALLVRANDATRTARTQKRLAQSEALVSESNNAVSTDPGRAFALAVRALGTKATPQAETALRSALSGLPLRSLQRYRGRVYGAEYNADGNRILGITGSEVVLVDAATGKTLRTIGNGDGIFETDLSRNGARIVTAGSDNRVRVWDAASGAQLEAWRQPQLEWSAIAPSGRQVAATSWSRGRVWIWTLGRTKPLKRRLPARQATGVLFSSDGTRLLSWGSSGYAEVFATGSGKVVARLGPYPGGYPGSVSAADLTPDGRFAALSGGAGARIADVWDVGTQRPLARVTEGGDITTLALSRGGKLLATAAGRAVHVWNARTGRLVADLRGHGDSVWSVEFSNDGNLLATASSDGTAGVWNVSSGARILTLRSSHSAVNVAVFSPDGRSLTTAGSDGTLRIWDTSSSRTFRSLRGPIVEAIFNRVGSRILTVDQDGRILVWNPKRPEHWLRRLHDSASQSVNAVRFSPDGRLFVTANSNDTAVVRRTSTAAAVAVAADNTALVNDAAFSPDGRRIVTVAADGWAAVFDTHDGKLVRWLHMDPANTTGAAHQGSANGVDWSPDGRSIVTVGDDGVARLWDARTGHLRQTFHGHEDDVHSVSFSKDGRFFVTAGADHTARVWSVASGRARAVLETAEPIRKVAFSPNGQRVVAGGAEGFVYVWDWRKPKLLAALQEHGDFVNSVQFSPNGKQILSASDDGTAKLYGCVTCGSLKQLRPLIRRYERYFR